MFKSKTPLITAVLALSSLIGIGTWSFRLIEGWSWAESFYFSVATLTTVGYGDIHPTTDGSRIFAAFYILIGVGIVIAALTRIGGSYLSTQEVRISDNIKRRVQRNESKKANRR